MHAEQTGGANIELDFSAFFREQYRSIVADAYFITGNRDDAMEIADEAFFRTFIRWGKISRYEKPGAWVRRITIRLSSRFKSRKVRESGELVDQPSGETDHSAAMDLRVALMKLPGQMRAAVVLHYYDDLPVAEVAAAMKCKESTVKRYLHDGRLRLRDLLVSR